MLIHVPSSDETCAHCMIGIYYKVCLFIVKKSLCSYYIVVSCNDTVFSLGSAYLLELGLKSTYNLLSISVTSQKEGWLTFCIIIK